MTYTKPTNLLNDAIDEPGCVFSHFKNKQILTQIVRPLSTQNTVFCFYLCHVFSKFTNKKRVYRSKKSDVIEFEKRKYFLFSDFIITRTEK